MFLLNSEVCFEDPHLRTIASRCCRSCQVSPHVSSTVQAEPKHPPNRTALHNYFLGQTLEKSHRLRMPATANVEGSPGNTKKRQSFHRSAPPRPVQDSIRYCLALAQSLENKTQGIIHFCRSAQANDLPAADTDSTNDIESGQQNSKSSYGGEFTASQSASSRAAGKPETKLRAGKGLSDVAKGQLCLMCVAALWGSYGPAIRCVKPSSKNLSPLLMRKLSKQCCSSPSGSICMHQQQYVPADTYTPSKDHPAQKHSRPSKQCCKQRSCWCLPWYFLVAGGKNSCVLKQYQILLRVVVQRSAALSVLHYAVAEWVPSI